MSDIIDLATKVFFLSLRGLFTLFLFQPNDGLSSLALTSVWASYLKLQKKTIKYKCNTLNQLQVLSTFFVMKQQESRPHLAMKLLASQLSNKFSASEKGSCV